MITRNDWLNQASQKLAKINANNSRLEAELILANVLRYQRIKLHLNPDKGLSKAQLNKANLWLKKRLKGVPLAYLTRQKEFFGLNFYMTKSVLVPRPESEIMIEQALEICQNLTEPIKILDLGCGSGALGISLAKNLSKQYQLTLADISNKALKIAKTNARKQKVPANFVKTNLMDNLIQDFDIILVNLPYVDPKWGFISQINYEPKQALYAADNGLFLIKKLIKQLVKRDNFYLLLESDPSQQNEIANELKKHGFKMIETVDYITICQKTKVS